MARHSNDALEIDTATDAAAAIVIGGLSDMSHALNPQVQSPQTGDSYDVAQFLVAQQPEIGFTTNAIKEVLDNIGLTGKLIDSDGSNPGLVAYAQKHDQAGTDARASTNHMSVTFGDGHLFIEQISGALGGEVTATLRAHGISSDGNTHPSAVAYNATLPSNKIDNQHYAIGKALINGVTVDRITNLTVAYNPQFDKSNDADTIYSSLVDPQRFSFLITITTEDPEWLDPTGATYIDDIGLQVTQHLSGSNAFYLLRRESAAQPTSGGGFKAFASGTNHILATFIGLVHVTQHYNASGTGISSTEIQIACRQDGATAPIIWDTTSNYPL